MADNLRALARRKARKYGLKPSVFVRQIAAESGFNPGLRSPAGALGVAQIMPATAKGWGVDPMDPEAALDAAAKNMAGYVRRFGSYENALRAYNAGPGAVEESRSYSETNNYVAKILGGKEPSTSSSSDDERGHLEERTTVDKVGLEGARRKAALRTFLERRNPNSTLAKFLPSSADPADFTKTENVSVKDSGTEVRHDDGPGSKKRPGALLELFHDPGVNLDNGREAAPVGGHGKHVHAAFNDPKALIGAAKLAKRMGLRVGENPKYDPVDPVHTEGSFHYQRFEGKPKLGKAIDVSGGTPAQLLAYNRALARRYG